MQEVYYRANLFIEEDKGPTKAQKCYKPSHSGEWIQKKIASKIRDGTLATAKEMAYMKGYKRSYQTQDLLRNETIPPT